MSRLPSLLLRLLLSLCLLASGAESAIAGIQAAHGPDRHPAAVSGMQASMHHACADTAGMAGKSASDAGRGHGDGVPGPGCCKAGSCDCASTQASVPLLRDLHLQETTIDAVAATTHRPTHPSPVLGTLIRPPIG